MLMAMLEEIEVSPDVYISHLKPGQDDRIMSQIKAQQGRLKPRALVQGEVFSF